MSHVKLSVLVGGFQASCARFASAPPESGERFHAIFEALAWVGSIRDRLRSESTATPPGLDGLYYVRNLVLHQGADVLDWAFFPGAELGTMVLGQSGLGSISRHAWVWPTLAQLPTPQSKAGAEDYDKHVARREVIDVLRGLSAALGQIPDR